MDAVVTAVEEAALRFKDINNVTSQGGSDIQKFYQGSVVFVTGANGFMGKLLVEKLLRACNVSKIFILLRGKKGKTTRERLEEMKRDPVFNCLRETKPNFGDKIVPVDGDVAGIHLGICDQDWRMLTDEVETIFHFAATTRFDERLQTATLINTRGTREVLYLAKQCLKLRVLVHVSTAYCHTTTDKVGVLLKEQFYPCPVPPDTLINLAETLDVNRMEAITPQLINGWPNTYTFTKAVAEELVRKTANEIPISIVRAPIVINTYHEPAFGWLDQSCIYGPTGIILAAILGIKHLACVEEKKSIVCLMPGDYVNNTILSSAWDCVQQRKTGDNDIKIYTVSSTKSNVRYSTIFNNLSEKGMRNYVTPKAIWYCMLIMVETKFVYLILSWFLHYIPAFIADLGIYVFKVDKPKGVKSFVNVFKKIDKMEATYDYFLRNGWCFDDKNVVELHQKMSPIDQTLFNLDASTINWKHMTIFWLLGIRKYILKENNLIDNNAINKQKIFKVGTYCVLFVYMYVFYCIFYILYSYFK